MAESVDGWLFEEALARTSDPRLWDRYQSEKRQQAPTLADLRRSLVEELLAKIGTKLFAAMPKPTGSASEWIVLGRAVLEKKVANEKMDEVRFFVPFKAPNAFEHVRDRGLIEAFQEYVLDDPEVAVLLKRNGTPDLFEGGRAPGWCVRYHWPLEATAADLAWSMDGGIFILGGPERRPTREVLMLCEAVADRIGVLRGLLISGKIRAFGLSNHFGESFVPVRQWARRGLSIDVANGDLGQEDSKGDFLPLWTGIEFRSATIEAISDPEPLKEAGFSTRKRSAMGQEVERIIRKHRIDVATQGRKASAAEVARHMANPPRSASAIRALETQVSRISKDVNKPR